MNPPNPPFPSLAIVGLGLMGGSLALALREAHAVHKIIGIDPRRAAREAALARGAIDAASDALPDAGAAGVIVLAAPVRTILRLLPELGEAAADGTLILDLGSTKERIVGAMDRLPPRLFAVGGHPMCGREASGFEAAEAGLFRNRVFVLTPTARSSPAALDRAADLARALGARPVVLDAARHDRLVAAVSHLPFVVAANLVGAVEEGMRGEGANGAQVWGLAASGFRDTTRLAASDVEMMLDILLTNGENIADWMRRYARQFAELADLISDGEEEALRARLARAAARRKELNRTDG